MKKYPQSSLSKRSVVRGVSKVFPALQEEVLEFSGNAKFNFLKFNAAKDGFLEVCRGGRLVVGQAVDARLEPLRA